MAKLLTRSALNPHPDIELGWKRENMDYYLAVPDEINEKTGVVLFIAGLDYRADFEYPMYKLRPYLADRFNLIAVGVNYFGIKSHPGNNPTEPDYITTPDFFDNLKKCCSIHLDPGPISMKSIIQAMESRGIYYLDRKCSIQLNFSDKTDYQSFGFLPALDHLHVLNLVLKEFPALDHSRIVILGSSYGGYIANLMAKFAPHTFSVVIDNSGLTRSYMHWIASNELHMPSKETLGINFIRFDREQHNLMLPIINSEPWTILDETSPAYYSDSHKKIRNLLEEKHRISSETRYYFFHVREDDIISYEEKLAYAEMLDRYNPVYFVEVTEKDLDGKLFKNLSHGMEASMRGLFALVSGIEEDKAMRKSNAETDFSLHSRYVFPCAGRNYVFQYSKQNGVSVIIEENE